MQSGYKFTPSGKRIFKRKIDIMKLVKMGKISKVTPRKVKGGYVISSPEYNYFKRKK